MKSYDHRLIEKKWQKKWDEDGTYVTPDKVSGKENYYALVEFPYPSGNIHVGHWYAFAVIDIFARKKRMEGKNVMFPFGFDAFGLPAENAAIKRNLNPRDWTYSNMEHMKKQICSMGASFDWSRFFVTCDPKYYKWTQWLFLQFFKNDLVTQKEARVNWCPSCRTVLANEQVINGYCERCDTEIEKRSMNQWSFGITQYADRLLEDLNTLNWPEEIKQTQRNWIGKSEGSEISFKIKDFEEDIRVFTTRADTLMGVTYVVLAPEHPLVDELKQRAKNIEEISTYQKKASKKKDIERTAEGKGKTGVTLEGITAVHPITGEEVSVWVADYILASYGTGAVMAVPAHDKRDFVFAKEYNLPIKGVVEPTFIARSGESAVVPGKEFIKRNAICAIVKNPQNNAYLCISWKKVHMHGFVTGGVDEGEDSVEAARREILEETGYKNLKHIEHFPVTIHSLFYHRVKKQNRWARFEYVFFELQDEERDDVSSKEDVIHDVIWKKKEEMEDFFTVVEGSYFVNFLLDEQETAFTGEGTLYNSGTFDWMPSEEAKEKLTEAAGGEMKTTYKLRDWSVSRQRYWGCPIPIVHCEKCGAVAVPEKDLPVVLPEVDDYLPNDEGKSPLAKVGDWVKVVCPECGGEAQRETDTLDTFVDSSWYFLRFCDPNNDSLFANPEKMEKWMPVDFYSGGAEHTTMHLLYARFFQKALFDFRLVKDKEPFKYRLNRGLILGPDGNKMSKSKGNVIDPDDLVKNVGADAIRTYLAFISPYNEVGHHPWNPDSLVGVRRFLERVYGLSEKIGDFEISLDLEILLHQTIKKVTDDYESLKFNTAISQMMILVNAFEKEKEISREAFKTLVVLLAPCAPHLTEELWHEVLREKRSIHLQAWPTYDKTKLASDMVILVVQINGKMRDTIEIVNDVTQQDVEKLAMESSRIQKWLNGKSPQKVIYVPGKVINLVI